MDAIKQKLGRDPSFGTHEQTLDDPLGVDFAPHLEGLFQIEPFLVPGQ
jgi:hypothetical protein